MLNTETDWQPACAVDVPHAASMDRHLASGMQRGAANDQKISFGGSAVVERRAVALNETEIEIVKLASHKRIETHFHGRRHVLIAYESTAGTEQGVGMDQQYTSSTLKSVHKTLTLIPAGQTFDEWYRFEGPCQMTCCYVNPEKTPISLCEEARRIEHRLHFDDPTLWESVQKIKRAVECGPALDLEYVELLGAVLVHEVLRRGSKPQQRRVPARGGLATWQQRVIVDFIENNLAERISLETLAKLAKLSPFHFCRAFRQSFGSPPHRYQIMRRIERAKELLTEPTTSVTDVGFTLGFGETSSFCKAFRKLAGLTATAYQRSQENLR